MRRTRLCLGRNSCILIGKRETKATKGLSMSWTDDVMTASYKVMGDLGDVMKEDPVSCGTIFIVTDLGLFQGEEDGEGVSESGTRIVLKGSSSVVGKGAVTSGGEGEEILMGAVGSSIEVESLVVVNGAGGSCPLTFSKGDVPTVWGVSDLLLLLLGVV